MPAQVGLHGLPGDLAHTATKPVCTSSRYIAFSCMDTDGWAIVHAYVCVWGGRKETHPLLGYKQVGHIDSF